MDGYDTNSTEGVPSRATALLFTGVLAVAIIGFLVGIDYGVPKPDIEPPGETESVPVDARPPVLPAMSYEEIGQTPIGPTRQWRPSLEQIPQPEQDLFAEITIDLDARRRSLQKRSERRAYNGAPPVVPHAVDQLSSDACLACHGEGLRIQNLTARQQPHPYLSNCLQCHAPPPPRQFEPMVHAANRFDGVSAPFEGERAWPGAPPTVPHSTFMRDNCLACHGPSGWPGMETTHPWRRNCLQCHAPSAALDQGIIIGGSKFLPPLEVESP